MYKLEDESKFIFQLFQIRREKNEFCGILLFLKEKILISLDLLHNSNTILNTKRK